VTADLVRTHLIAQGVVVNTLTAGASWICLEGGLSDQVEAPQVAVMDRTGLPPLASHGNTGPIRPAFQVLVRGLPGTYPDTKSKATAVWDALHRQTVTGLMAVFGVGSPNWLQFDDSNRPVWSLNFTTIKE
jgi:hypothetical protein